MAIRFFYAGAVMYFITCLQCAFQVTWMFQKVIHFTDWVPGHAHLVMFGVFGFWCIGMLVWTLLCVGYFIVTRQMIEMGIGLSLGLLLLALVVVGVRAAEAAHLSQVHGGIGESDVGAPRFEVLDRSGYTMLQRLIETGIVNFAAAEVRRLHERASPTNGAEPPMTDCGASAQVPASPLQA